MLRMVKGRKYRFCIISLWMSCSCQSKSLRNLLGHRQYLLRSKLTKFPSHLHLTQMCRNLNRPLNHIHIDQFKTQSISELKWSERRPQENCLRTSPRTLVVDWDWAKSHRPPLRQSLCRRDSEVKLTT